MSDTKHKPNIELLQSAERRSHRWLEHSPVCTKIVDLDFNLQYMSESGIKGLSIPDISTYYGRPYPFEFYPELFRSHMIKTMKSARDTGKFVTQEDSVVNIYKEVLWFHSTIVPMFDKNNELEYYMIISIDTTERKSAEMELYEMNIKLESLVSSRTKELEVANEQLKINSETDFLTKLSNRRFYERRLLENIATARRNNTYLSLLIIDIDNFKAYNDTYGHDFGDIILCEISESIAGSLHRSTDLVSRFGGEEFTVLLPETNARNAFGIAEKIRKNIFQLDLNHGKSKTGIVTVSIGIAALKGNELNKVDLFKNTDTALYLAKDAGKNCCNIYPD